MSLLSRFGTTVAMAGLAAAAYPALAGDYSTQDTASSYSNAATFETTTDANSPTFDRPKIALGDVTTDFSSGLSGVYTHVGYAATDFTAASTGLYRVTTQVESGYPINADKTSNFEQFVYKQPFDPTNPLTNIQLAYNPPAESGSYALDLSNGDALTFVNGGRYNNDSPAGDQYSLGTVKTIVDEYHPGTTQIIPQADNLGNNGVVSQTLTLPGSDTILAFNSFTFDGLQHNAVGDLTATLTHDGVTVTLFDQPDNNSPDPYNFGSLASFDSTRKYTFADTGADLAAAATDTVNSAPVTDANPPLSSATFKSLDGLSAFNGLGLAGAWTLSLINNQSSSVGSFLGFSFNANTTPTPVPEASTVIPMGMGCVLLGVLFWKRRPSSAKLS